MGYQETKSKINIKCQHIFICGDYQLGKATGCERKKERENEKELDSVWEMIAYKQIAWSQIVAQVKNKNAQAEL